jgi:hypothetical protein
MEYSEGDVINEKRGCDEEEGSEPESSWAQVAKQCAHGHVRVILRGLMHLHLCFVFTCRPRMAASCK